MFRREYQPTKIEFFTRLAEEIGFDEVWFVEDLNYHGGIAQVSTALAVTKKIIIGLGIMPIMVRNPAFVAMEINTLGTMFPNRFIAGFGHGVSSWMEEVGILPKSQLQAMKEMVSSISRLTKGDKTTLEGKYVHLENIKLNYIPESPVPIYLGVSGPKSIKISKEFCQGILLPEHHTLQQIKSVKAQLNDKNTNETSNKDYKLAVYIWCSVNTNENTAYNELRTIIANSIEKGYMNHVFQELQVPYEVVAELMTKKEWFKLIPKEWIDPIAVVGTPENCIKKINSFIEAGVNSLILVPLETQTPEILLHYKENLMNIRTFESE